MAVNICTVSAGIDGANMAAWNTGAPTATSDTCNLILNILYFVLPKKNTLLTTAVIAIA